MRNEQFWFLFTCIAAVKRQCDNRVSSGGSYLGQAHSLKAATVLRLRIIEEPISRLNKLLSFNTRFVLSLLCHMFDDCLFILFRHPTVYVRDNPHETPHS